MTKTSSSTLLVLTPEEQLLLNALPAEEGAAWRLWKAVGRRIGVDFTDSRNKVTPGRTRGKYTITTTSKQLTRRPELKYWEK